MHTTNRPAFIALLLLPIGCYSAGGVLERDSGGTVDASGFDGGRLDAAGLDAPGLDAPGPTYDTRLPLADAPRGDAPRFVADAPRGDGGGEIWEGYVEAYTFASGSDRVRLVLDSATGDGPRTGTVTFGMGTPPAPATDPLVGYPPGGRLYEQRFFEGFAYPLESGTRTGRRTQVGWSLNSMWEAWCQLQTPYEQEGSWNCLPYGSAYLTEYSEGGFCAYGVPHEETFVPVDCGQLGLCIERPVCTCTAAGCNYWPVAGSSMDFTASGDTATGTLLLLDGSFVIHLTRMP